MANHELGTPVADLGEVPGVQGGRGGGGLPHSPFKGGKI